jgi:S1-C subfamily serine protease
MKRAIAYLGLNVAIWCFAMGDQVTAQRAIPNQHLGRPVLIEIAKKSSGSGFYINTDDAVWFVTAKHVLFDEKNQLRGDRAELLSYGVDDDVGTLLDVDLNVLTAADLLRSSKVGDAAVMKIGIATESKSERQVTVPTGVSITRKGPDGVYGTTLTDVRSYDDVAIGNDIIVLGYPLSIGLANIPQIDYKRPLLKKGSVAGKNSKLRTLIIDCETFPGNSGGPVIEVEQYFAQSNFRVIGLISQFVPFDNARLPGLGNTTLLNSGYSVVTPMDLVLELIK